MNSIQHFVYVMSNPSFYDDIFKIGWSREHPQVKAQDISRLGVSTPYVVEYVIITNNGLQLKKEIHERLDEYRVTHNRDFFRLLKQNIFDILTKEMNLLLTPIHEIRVSEKPIHDRKLQRLISLCKELENNAYEFFDQLQKENADVIIVYFNFQKYVTFHPMENYSKRLCMDIHGYEGEDERRIKLSYYFINRDMENFEEWLNNLIDEYEKTDHTKNTLMMEEDDEDGWFEEMIAATEKELDSLKTNYVWEF